MAEVRFLGRPDIDRLLEEMRARPINFDPSRSTELTPANGWHLDDFCQPLPEGSFEAAKEIAIRYDFADPSIVRAFYDTGEPLEHRTMLLELRFAGLRVYVGTRVGDVYDDRREVGGRVARVWGWGYRTLDGHVEAGEMHWQVWRWLDTGEVQFRIHAYSRRAPGGNPLLRLGFFLVGRREQLRFLRHTCERMAVLTAAAVGAPTPGAGELTVRPASRSEALRARLDPGVGRVTR